MPSLSSPRPAAGGGDDLDALFDYDVAMDDAATSRPNPNGQQNASRNTAGDTGPIGVDIDTEVQIKKKRTPVPKLDEERLLSAKGIPRLRTISKKDKLRFKGKGHEYQDIARLLTHYQLWLDNLYPRAKFLDALTMVEALGHKKRMQVMRRQWIDEGKPKGSLEDGGDADLDIDLDFEPAPAVRERSRSISGENDRSTMSGALPSAGEPDDDELDALLAEEDRMRTETTIPFARRKPNNDDNGPDDDELDALLADEDGMRDEDPTRHRPQAQKSATSNESDDDELDALLADEDSIRQQSTHKHSGEQPDDDDDLDALLADEGDMQTEQQSTSARKIVAENARNAEPDEDELDALMAEQEDMT